MSEGHRRDHHPKGGMPAGGIVRAQPVTEASLMESVAGFITEVQAFNQGHSAVDGSKATVTWATFEKADLNDPTIFPEAMEINGKHPVFLLPRAISYSPNFRLPSTHLRML